MRANQFTQGAQTALRLAQESAGELGHSYIGSEHLLLGILGGEECDAKRCLAEQGVSSRQVREALVGIVGRGLAGQAQTGHPHYRGVRSGAPYAGASGFFGAPDHHGGILRIHGKAKEPVSPVPSVHAVRL